MLTYSYIVFDFSTHLLLIVMQISQLIQWIIRKISERKICAYTVTRKSEKWAFHIGIQKNRVIHILFVEKRGPIIYLAALKKAAIRHAHPHCAIYRKLPPPPPPLPIILRNGACFPLVCNFYYVFMIYIISDNKSNFEYDFTLLGLYFINNGEDIVRLLIWNQWRNGVIFFRNRTCFPLVCNLIVFSFFSSFLWCMSYLTIKTIFNMILLYWSHIL